jgi:hypothetical protein
MRRKIQEGLFPWKPPLGYKSANRPGAKKTVPDVPDPSSGITGGLSKDNGSEILTGINWQSDRAI